MNNKQFIVLHVTLEEVDMPVWRDVAIQADFTLDSIDVVLQQLFDMPIDAEYTYDIEGEMDQNLALTNSFREIFFAQATSFLCFVQTDAAKWEFTFQITDFIEHQEMDLPFFCMNGEGQGVLNGEISNKTFNQIIDAALLGETDFSAITDLPLHIHGHDIFDMDVYEVNEHIQDKFLMQSEEDTLLEKKEVLDDAFEGIDEQTVIDTHYRQNNDQAEKAEEEFILNAELIDFYVNVVGLSEVQASYYILFESTVNGIYAYMERAGYTEQEIEAVLTGQTTLDADLYDAIGEDIELLQTLPKREEIFTEEDEQKVDQIESLIYNMLEDKGLTFEEMEALSESELHEMEEEFLTSVQKSNNTLLS